MFHTPFDKINELVASAKAIAIVVPRNPTFDSMAAALALSLSLEKTGKKALVFCETPVTVDLGNLVGVNMVKQPQAKGGSNNGLIISLPYEQGAIEKISYDIVGDRINLTVVPGPAGLTFSTEDITYETPRESYDLIITVGVPQEPELAFDEQKSLPLLNIDYMIQNTGYGTVAFIDESYGSYAEMATKLLSELKLSFDLDIAQNLMSGLIDATSNFQKRETSAFAFEAASLLMQKGAQRVTRAEPAFIQKQQSFPRQTRPRVHQQQQWQGKNLGSKQVPQAHSISSGQAGAGQTDNKKQPAPKDWLEPKIYRGSTPVS